MKRLAIMLLSMSMFMFTCTTNCMFNTLRLTKTRFSPQYKRFDSHQNSLTQRMSSLENTVRLQENELAEIKAIVGRWNKNNQDNNNLPKIYDPLMDEALHNDSFIDVHNMHYGNGHQQ